MTDEELQVHPLPFLCIVHFMQELLFHSCLLGIALAARGHVCVCGHEPRNIPFEEQARRHRIARYLQSW